MISWFTALRKEACFRLAWEHIDEDSDIPSITIMPGKTARFGRAVYIPIHRQLWRYLKSLPRPASDKTPILSQFPYIANWDRKRSYFVGLLNSLDIFSSEDGKAGFHSIRGSFITRCDEQNVDRRATKGVAGQVDDYVTDLYSRDKETAKQILRLPEVDV
jgi:integrase